MSLDTRDPHYALGIEHGRAAEEPYEFQDAENLRRYLIGYECGAAQRRLDGLIAPLTQQQPRRITATEIQRYWMNQQKP